MPRATSNSWHQSTLVGLIGLALSCGESRNEPAPALQAASGSGGASSSSATGSAAARGYPECLPDPICGFAAETGSDIDCTFEFELLCGNYQPAVPAIDCEAVARWRLTGGGGEGGEGEVQNYSIEEGILTLSDETCEHARRVGRVDYVFDCVRCP